MNGYSRVAVAEISLTRLSIQSSCDHGFRKSVASEEKLLAFAWRARPVKGLPPNKIQDFEGIGSL